jgi:hypothetical protein
MHTTRKIFAVILLLVSLFSTILAQNDKPQNVKVRFRNNSIAFRKVTIITYFPTEAGNSTEGLVLAPYFSTVKKYAVGTKIYFADKKQVGIVMSGDKLNGTPFMVVKAEDEGKTFNIFK